MTLTFYQQLEKHLFEKFASLTPQEMFDKYNHLVDIFSDEGLTNKIQNKPQLHELRFFKYELTRRLQTGWKIAILYDVFNTKIDSALILIDDPGINRNYKTKCCGYFKKNSLYLRDTHMALTKLEGKQNDEHSRFIGSYLLERIGKKVNLMIAFIKGEVIPNQEYVSPNETWKVIILRLDNIDLYPYILEEVGEIRNLSITVEISEEAETYLDMWRQLNASALL